MKNESTTAPLSEEDFNKGMEALEEEYEQELQKLHAEIEQEKIRSADTSKSQFEK